jgi:nicotinamidase-related amidase
VTSTALLVMDVQGSVVERFGGDTEYLPRLASAIEAARGAGIPVIYVTFAFRPGYPEASARNKTFSAFTGTGRFGR